VKATPHVEQARSPQVAQASAIPAVSTPPVEIADKVKISARANVSTEKLVQDVAVESTVKSKERSSKSKVDKAKSAKKSSDKAKSKKDSGKKSTDEKSTGKSAKKDAAKKPKKKKTA
jgi:hypothetical protein